LCLVFSLWSRFQSEATSGIADIFQPDEQVIHSSIPSSSQRSNGTLEHGRITIRVLSNGSASHNYDPVHARVTDNEVFLSLRLTSVDAMTLYAVRRLKIESQEKDFTTRLIPMQPNVQRRSPVVDGIFVNKSKPVDFTCTEFDLSALPSGT
jgi:hypothetical protein